MAELLALNKTKAFWIEDAGGKAFCAGGDIKSLYEGRESKPTFWLTSSAKNIPLITK
jgi:enoyl-CoA hydratase/carnithine racemase